MSKALLHIGLGKCLSTSLQNVWDDSGNYDFISLKNITKKVQDIIIECQGNLDRFIDQIDRFTIPIPTPTPHRQQVLSCEGMTYSFLNQPLLADYIPLKQKALAKVLSPYAETIFLIVRNPRDWIVSSYSQYVKQGGTISLSDSLRVQRMTVLNNLNLSNIIGYYEEFGCKIVIMPLEISKKSEDDFWQEYENRLGRDRPVPSQFPSDTTGANITKKETIALHMKLNLILQRLEDIASKGEFANKKNVIEAFSLARKWGTRRALTVSDKNDIQELGDIVGALVSVADHDFKIDKNFADDLMENFLEPLKQKSYFPYENMLFSYQRAIESMIG